MLSFGKFPAQVRYNTLQRNPISRNPQFHSKPQFSYSTHLNFNALLEEMRSELCCIAFKTKRKGGISVKEMEVSEEDFDDEFLDIEDEGEIEEEDELVVPLINMKKWLKNKPRGFGEGKVYDTPIEDKLMEEIEQSRKAQLANINKLKNNPVEANSKKETIKKDKGPALTPDGFRVRLVNLPKKKNIHRDLRLAYKEVPGIVNIVPVVSGNEKTRDPVCKGLAFVDFKRQEDAQRFIQNFSGKYISFGKVQKQVKCEIVNSKLPDHESVDAESDFDPQETVLNSNEGLVVDVEINASLSDSSEDSSTSGLEDADEEHVLGHWEEVDEGEINGLAEEWEVEEGSSIESSSKHTRRSEKNEKKAASKRRKDGVPKLYVPGSANKLKIKDKAILAGVFSKYGSNAISTVEEQRR